MVFHALRKANQYVAAAQLSGIQEIEPARIPARIRCPVQDVGIKSCNELIIGLGWTILLWNSALAANAALTC